MNPDTCVKNWLIAVGDQFGIRNAEDIRWPDQATRQNPDNPYFVYRIIAAEPMQVGVQPDLSRSGSTVTQAAWQMWQVSVQVDLYNCPEGMYVLPACCIALRHNGTLQKLCKDQSCAYLDGQEPTVVNNSTWDDHRIYDHHTMVVMFTENIRYSIDETNTHVEQVRISFDIDGDTVNANASIAKIVAETATLTISGAADLST